MNTKLKIAAAFFCLLNLAACGGGGGGSSSSSSGASSAQPTALSETDTVVGTGATAANGNTLTVNYTGWLYNASATNFEGTQFDTGSFSFVLGAGQVIPGFDQGMVGAKAGGTRMLIIPASLAYGAAGSGTAIPPNAGLVFSVQLVSVQ